MGKTFIKYKGHSLAKTDAFSTQIEERKKYDEYIKEHYEMPANMPIPKGTRISGLDMMQHPKLAKFVDNNPGKFVYYANMDVAEYIGPDTVIP